MRSRGYLGIAVSLFVDSQEDSGGDLTVWSRSCKAHAYNVSSLPDCVTVGLQGHTPFVCDRAAKDDISATSNKNVDSTEKKN